MSGANEASQRGSESANQRISESARGAREGWMASVANVEEKLSRVGERVGR
jgi:hypothetical protein